LTTATLDGANVRNLQPSQSELVELCDYAVLRDESEEKLSRECETICQDIENQNFGNDLDHCKDRKNMVFTRIGVLF
jgi:hypothetical protein